MLSGYPMINIAKKFGSPSRKLIKKEKRKKNKQEWQLQTVTKLFPLNAKRKNQTDFD